ncbi:KpsF/GutQ family sugar-phosphate isomerase [Ferruginivarius sediminum]|uniref:KpsF/GutQ family sugar-phosphate isomerase n=1 Tax=Ferruginivarius sediminum TaxID=2661937 RepID=A0A369T8C5_9PROT|nr:KpsF/GutQ family sugar-phosphate isomerase [Ferruginivarius sediminum]RDD61528.1 KpsF/GutQ family sugar-phosphate isomerase [Ferruginivarius sediminum]
MATQLKESPDLLAARRVLSIEGDSLKALAAALDGSFVAAVEALLAATGRVVVTGMGKSGHVARKIAATLSSTGTPALYVHPGEASHGDLGMIAEGDAVVALSNSGNTSELSDVIAYTRRFGITLIAMTARRGSTLAKEADCVLLLPEAEEACPMGLAPTTSTTLMLALGDALAVALLERKQFSSSDFQLLHPGGTLGRRLLRVDDIMHGGDELPLTTPETPMRDAIIIMTTRRFGCVGVTGEDGRLMGIVTDGDLRRHMNADLLSQSVAEVMTAEPKTIRQRALAAEALGLMNRQAITSLFVVADNGRPAGILHIHDCLRAGIA